MASPAFSQANASLQNVSSVTATAAPTHEAAKTATVHPQVPTELAPLATPTAPVVAEAPEATAEAPVVKPDIELAPQFAAPPKPVIKTPPPGVLPPQVVRDAKSHRTTTPSAPKKRKTPMTVWFGAGLGALLLVAGGAAAGAYSKFASGSTIAPNVFIAGVPVGGLTPEVANQRLRAHFGKPQISLLCADKTVQIPIEQLGAKLSIEPTVKKAYSVGRDGFLPNNLLRVYGTGGNGKNFMLPIEWDKAQLVHGLTAVNSKVAIAPVDARLQAGEVGLEVVPDHTGRELNAGAAAHLLQSKFYVGMPSLHVPSRAVVAKITANQLEGRDVQLAQYSTRFNPGLAGRTENLHIACRAIQNHVLMPGETFSFNACTGERTASKGYRMAHIFLRQPGEDESEVVEGLAGGVCQVSSTLFNAVRKTNAEADINPLKVVERNTHSLPVTYVPHGLDATVAWPYKDFKFRNVTTNPVYVRTQINGSRLSISIWNRVPLA